jgi:hypothetical protein
MKLSKKILAAFSATALLATASFFTSCSDDDEDSAFSGKKVDFDNSYVTVTKATDGSVTVKNAKATDSGAIKNTAAATETTKGYFYRAFNKLTAKHYGSTCTIKLTPQTDGVSYDASSNSANGVAGFVFNLKENETDSTAYDFDIAAIQYDGSKIRTYVSKYENAALKDNNFTAASNFTASDGATAATETEILKGDSSVYYDFSASDFTKDSDGAISVAIKVTANDDGSYTVDYLDAANSTTPKKTVTIASNLTGYTAKTQAKMAMYANIYPGQHFVADFAFTDTVGNAIPFEDEVVEE